MEECECSVTGNIERPIIGGGEQRIVLAMLYCEPDPASDALRGTKPTFTSSFRGANYSTCNSSSSLLY